MRRMKRKNYKKDLGQTAMEYLLILGVMTAIALVAFRTMLPVARQETNLYFNAVTTNLLGSTAVIRYLDTNYP